MKQFDSPEDDAPALDHFAALAAWSAPTGPAASSSLCCAALRRHPARRAQRMTAPRATDDDEPAQEAA